MHISYNGQPIQIDTEMSLADFIKQHAQLTPPFAVAMNGNFMPKDTYEGTKIKHNDAIEIVIPMQGG